MKIMFRLTMLDLLGVMAIAICLHSTQVRGESNQAIQSTLPSPFSSARPGGPLPKGWAPFDVTKFKKHTTYTLVDDGGSTVVKASSSAAASGIGARVAIDPHDYPMLEWRWKPASLIASADNAVRQKEDSPVRVIVGFDGDATKLSAADQRAMQIASGLSGQELPYATLMYIWENKAAVDTIIPNARTQRVQMLVVESGARGVNEWHTYTRNLMEDFRRAFGEEPGKIISIGIMTDTDNTGEEVEAYYGDIAFKRGAP